MGPYPLPASKRTRTCQIPYVRLPLVAHQHRPPATWPLPAGWWPVPTLCSSRPVGWTALGDQIEPWAEVESYTPHLPVLSGPEKSSASTSTRDGSEPPIAVCAPVVSERVARGWPV